MSAPGGDMTATQIAARNRRARLEADAGAHGGPFDASPLEHEPDVTPPVPDEADLRARLAKTAGVPIPAPPSAAAPAPTEGSRFAAGPRPRIVEGIVVPAVSVADDPLATWILLPVGEVTSIGLTGRAVGVTPRGGRWLPVWIGDDLDERAAVLDQFAGDVGHARRVYR